VATTVIHSADAPLQQKMIKELAAALSGHIGRTGGIDVVDGNNKFPANRLLYHGVENIQCKTFFQNRQEAQY
jgi:hypothetical protein